MHISRPSQLFSLFASTTDLPGIGARLASILNKRIGNTVIDVLRHLPVGVIDRNITNNVQACENGEMVTIIADIISADIPPPRTSRPARFTVSSDGQVFELIFFRAKADYLSRILPIGERRIISGRLDRYDGRMQISHPDYILSLDKRDDMPAMEPVYPLSQGLKPKILRNAIQTGLRRLPGLPEWIDPQLCRRFNWPDYATAMKQAHAPQTIRDISPDSPVRMRLAYDELLANQIALQIIRIKAIRSDAGRSLCSAGKLRAALLAQLPYQMTGAQQRVTDEILRDMHSPTRMLRLLQGDVGSGKTLVAVLAMLEAVENKTQAALLAPTEILARQHYDTISSMLEGHGVEIALLTGQMKAAERNQTLERISSGSCHIVIGTHALLSDTVNFSDLGLAVVDEQHRFGVRQRLILGQKGQHTDVLVMTATPIPRTLAMTAYGDLTTSILDEKPAHRKQIKTALVSQERVDEIIQRLQSAFASQQRAYWICPLVEETDNSDYEAAESRYRLLCKLLPDANAQLAHGKMKSAERDAAMQLFASGGSQLLVATTVVEVGVDVPQASIIIIEHAERFGLAQLHQLRGRVGRGSAESYCLLLYKSPLNETAKSRLNTMRNHDDGFIIAEEDLRLRGPGEVLGQRQSGLPEFKLADLAVHSELIGIARQQAEQIIQSDPDLSQPESAPYRALLSLFEKDVAVQFLASG